MADIAKIASRTDQPRRGRPPRTAEERASRREDLVRRVMDTIRGTGAEVSLDDLAAGAGVSKPVLYDRFGSRVGVADAIAEALAHDLEVDVTRRLSAETAVDVDRLVDALIEGFVAMVDEEGALYEFVVRAFWNDGRGLLGNPLVRILHERLLPLVTPRRSGRTGGAGSDELEILLDGLYGFMLAAVQSWKSRRALSRDEMVALLGSLLREALRTVQRQPGRISLGT